MAPAYCFDQSRRAQARIGAQFQRIAPGLVEPPQDDVDRAQAFDRLQPDMAVAHGQVVALGQGVAQAGGQVGMLEIGLVGRAGGQDNDLGLVAGSACQMVQGCLDGFQPGREAGHGAFFEQFWKGACHDRTVLDGIASAGRCLATVGHHPDTAVRAACQIGGIEGQLAAVGGQGADQRPQEAGVAEHQVGRNQAALQ
jgi:hypothetical protein